MSRSKWVGMLIGVVLLTFGVERVQAQQDIQETCTLTATILINNTNSTHNTNTTAFSYPPPTMVKFATKDLLALIAKAEYHNGNYTATNFPSGAKLIKFGSDSSATFTVRNQTNGVLLSSDITYVIGFNNVDFPTFTATGTDNNSTAGSETDYGMGEIFIYDLDAGGNTDLTLDGYVVNTIKTSAINQNTGTINNNQAFTMKALGGVGAIGNNDNENCAISGSFSAKGTAQTY